MRKLCWIIIISVNCLRADFVSADEIVMNNGSRLIGTIVSAVDDKIEFKTEFAGTISIDADSVDYLFTDNEVTVMLKDGRVIENQRIAGSENALVMMSDDNEALVFEGSDMKRLNPKPWELGRGYNWTGNLSFTGLLERGNTKTDEMDFFAEAILRSLKDRFTFTGRYELDRNAGVRNKNNWRLRNKYDIFSTQDQDNYRGMLMAFEKDEFSDIALRSMIGPYIGRQFYEGNILTLSGETGMVWVKERFNSVDDDSGLREEKKFAGATWDLNITSDYFGDISEFYVKHDGIMNLEQSDDVLLNTTIGIKFEVRKHIEVGVEARYEFDSEVGEGIDEVDETYKLRFGYKW